MSKRAGFRVFLVGILLCFGAAWAASEWDVRRLKGELQGVALQREAFYREVAQVVDGDNSVFDVVSVVTVTRKFGLIGSPHGKITIYQRSHEPIGHFHSSEEPDSENLEEHEEHEEGHDTEDEDARFFSGIQYFYEKVEGEWLNTESGQCSSEECQTEGRKAFERAET
ncbi:MAG: hypothetical protein IID08_10310 [Candidatus Hydrogenedentes bacterium]|nr:hypothetical protein [Candidatus Hydrogenedentota bacterium]